MYQNMVMFKVNVFEAKAKLSEYLDRAAAGERIVICRHNRPIAELRPVGVGRTESRPIGPLPGRPTFEVAAAFFEPMSDDELTLWEAPLAGAESRSVGRGATGGSGGGRVPKVAEAKATYKASRGGRARRRRS